MIRWNEFAAWVCVGFLLGAALGYLARHLGMG